MIQKFRFWYEREDFYPDENFMCDVYKIEYIADNKIELNDAYIFNPYTNVAEDFYAKAKIYLMQSTGLKDKNGVEIYEGDILYHPLQGVRKVFYPYSESVASYGLREISTGFGSTLQDAHAVWKVIGNIYEHNHLLG